MKKSYSVSFTTKVFVNDVFKENEKNAIVVPAKSEAEVTEDLVKNYARHLIKEGSTKAYNPENIWEPLVVRREFNKIEGVRIIPYIDNSNWVEVARKEDAKYKLIN